MLFREISVLLKSGKNFMQHISNIKKMAMKIKCIRIGQNQACNTIKGWISIPSLHDQHILQLRCKNGWFVPSLNSTYA